MTARSANEAIRIADQWYVLATSSRADDRTRVLKHGDTFAVLDRAGDVHPVGAGELGLYHGGTRYLSTLELRISGERPMLLNSNVKRDNSLLAVDLTTPDLYEDGEVSVRKGTVHLFRSTFLWEAACYLRLRIVNYGEREVRLPLSIDFHADYADIFEVRGFRRARRGHDLQASTAADAVAVGYEGLDGAVRRTRLEFSPPPLRVFADHVDYFIRLGPHETTEICVTVSCASGFRPAAPVDFARAFAQAENAMKARRSGSCRIATSNQQFNDWLERSRSDLAMLTLGNPEGPYPYAGVPWYSTPFGRDGILTAQQFLWVDPSMARSVLSFLASMQADTDAAAREAEPGKILHEMRRGELAALGEIPFGRYYGSVDSTPLFVVLAASYFMRTADLDFVRGLWPSLERALAWIERYGDADGDGFVEYHRRNAAGLLNQGWRDSEDALFHRDGEAAEGSIALAEVQAYVYRAKRGAARMAEALGLDPRAAALRREARELRLRFDRAFWCDDIGTYAHAIDGAKRQCQVRASAAGHALWCGIADPARVRSVADSLMSAESFSGWGVRTIAEGESRFNPMSYHNGSIWPHDNALVAAGLARYGMKEAALAITGAMFDASLYMDLHRLPELFCGFARRSDEGPTLYPVACSPQAWASASAFYFLQACMGLRFQPGAPQVRFEHPRLPQFLDYVEITDLQVGQAVLDISLQRTQRDVAVNVVRKEGDVDVSVVL